ASPEGFARRNFSCNEKLRTRGETYTRRNLVSKEELCSTSRCWVDLLIYGHPSIIELVETRAQHLPPVLSGAHATARTESFIREPLPQSSLPSIYFDKWWSSCCDGPREPLMEKLH
ncbi:hypothetical protein TorRG33x02_315570, partial [Trema orientale]